MRGSLLPPYAPLEALDIDWIQNKSISLYIKREDLSHPFISGNKWRKLHYHLLAADESAKTHLQTFGGPYSNHILATAAAGAKYGFTTGAFVRGEEVSNPVLVMCQMFGMQLQFVAREAYRNKEALEAEYLAMHSNAYVIPEGGGGELGEKGAAMILDDLTPDFSHIVLSVGTGATLRGVASGLQMQNRLTQVEGILVLKGMESMDADWQSNNTTHNYTLHHRFHRGGYAKTDNDLLAFIKEFASHTGILLDQVYEAKMMMGLFTLIKEDYFKPDSRIVALHNGGLSGLSSLW